MFHVKQLNLNGNIIWACVIRFISAVLKHKMDEEEFKVLAEFKRFGKLPKGLFGHKKLLFLRKAESFVIESELCQMYTWI